MRLAVDTNILVRYLVQDDPAQAEVATRVMESGDTIVLTTLVLCETVWVLRRAYRFSPEIIEQTLRALIESEAVEVIDQEARVGLEMLGRGGDFADGCILAAANAARCDRVLTFDETFARLGGALVAVPQ